jgi:hypothetical protein
MTNEEMVLFKSTLETMQDIAGYLEKSDDLQKQVAIQERAKIDKPPKAQEFNDEIEGGAAASNKPAEGIAKEYIPIPENPKKSAQTDLKSSGQTMIKAEDKDESSEESSETDQKDEEVSDSAEEFKSLLKDIRDALSKSEDIESKIEAGIKKALPGQMDRMLRKMGFNPTRPDVTRLGIDSNSEVVKSKDELEVKADISKSDNDAISEAINSDKSFTELARMREKLGLFKAF